MCGLIQWEMQTHLIPCFSRFFKLPMGFSVHTSLGEGLEIYLATVKYHGLKKIHTCGYD